MRVLHTSDWHVDLHVAHLGEAAAVVSDARWQAAEKLTEIAKERSVDLVLIAGDTFDKVDADDDTVARVVEILNAFAPARVIVLPGNHDPLMAGGVWERKPWEDLDDHVTLALTAEPIEWQIPIGVEAGTDSDKSDSNASNEKTANVVVFPCPIRQKQSRLDPTAEIPSRAADDPSLRLGLAHGSSEAFSKAESFPIPLDRARQSGLDYLALGDWHGQRVFAGQDTAYSGTPEATSFAEPQAGGALIVDLDVNRSKPLTIEPVSVAACRWLQREILLRDATDLAELEADLLALGSADRAVVRLQVRLVQEPADGGSGTSATSATSATLTEQSQTSLLRPPVAPSEDGNWVETVEAFRSKWAQRVLYLDWQLEELTLDSGDLPAGLAAIDESLIEALAGKPNLKDADPKLMALLEEDESILREARWQLRLLAAETAA